MFDLTEATHRRRGRRRCGGGPAGAGQHGLQAGRQGLSHDDGRGPARPPSRRSRTPAPTSSAATARSPPSPWPTWCPSWPNSTAALTYAQPNAGQPRLEDGATVYEETPEHFAAIVATYPALGAGSSAAAAARRPPPSPRWPRPSAATASLGRRGRPPLWTSSSARSATRRASSRATAWGSIGASRGARRRRLEAASVVGEDSTFTVRCRRELAAGMQARPAGLLRPAGRFSPG